MKRKKINRETEMFLEFSDKDIEEWVTIFDLGIPLTKDYEESFKDDKKPFLDGTWRLRTLYHNIKEQGYKAFLQRLYKIFVDDEHTEHLHKEDLFVVEEMYKRRERERGNVIF